MSYSGNPIVLKDEITALAAASRFDAVKSASIMIHPNFRYTEAHHAQYERLGYCFFDAFLSDAGLTRCRAEVDRMLTQLAPGASSDEIYSAHQWERWMFDIATQSPVLDMIERQIGPDIVLWATHLLCKPPRTGRPVPWHQDAPYWNVSGNLAGAVWIPFDDIAADNGPMAVLPAWHNRGALPRLKTEKDFFSEEIAPSALPADIDAIKVEYKLKAGQAATHHTMIPHNSVPNRSDRWRRVLVLRYLAADGTMGERLYSDYRTGAKFPRRFYLVRGRDVMNRGLVRSPFE